MRDDERPAGDSRRLSLRPDLHRQTPPPGARPDHRLQARLSGSWATCLGELDAGRACSTIRRPGAPIIAPMRLRCRACCAATGRSRRNRRRWSISRRRSSRSSVCPPRRPLRGRAFLHSRLSLRESAYFRGAKDDIGEPMSKINIDSALYERAQSRRRGRRVIAARRIRRHRDRK